MTALEKFAIEYLVELNNSVYHQQDYDKRRYQMQMYNKFFRRLPESLQARLDLPYPVPMVVDFLLFEEVYNASKPTEKVVAYKSFFGRLKWK